VQDLGLYTTYILFIAFVLGSSVVSFSLHDPYRIGFLGEAVSFYVSRTTSKRKS